MVASWLIIQVVSAVNRPLSLPEWFETVVVVLLAVGFPMALLFTWAFELTPEGIKLTSPDYAAAEQADGSRLDYILVGPRSDGGGSRADVERTRQRQLAHCACVLEAH